MAEIIEGLQFHARTGGHHLLGFRECDVGVVPRMQDRMAPRDRSLRSDR